MWMFLKTTAFALCIATALLAASTLVKKQESRHFFALLSPRSDSTADISARRSGQITYTRHAQGEPWQAPTEELKHIGMAEHRQQMTPRQSSSATKNDGDERDLQLFACDRRCLFRCGCDGYTCKSSSRRSLQEEQEDDKVIQELIGNVDLDSLSDAEVEALENKAIEELEARGDRDLFLFGRRCMPGDFTCEIPGNRKCGVCQQTYTTFSEYSGSCYTAKFCLERSNIDTGNCARGTDKCFQNNCTDTSETENGGEGKFCTYDTYPGTCKNDQRRRKLAGSQEDIFGIEEEQDDEDQDLPFQNDLDLLAFVRVPKSGSTSLMNFLTSTKRMYAWDSHLSAPKDVEKGRRRSGAVRVAGCIFGYAATKAHLGNPGSSKFWNRCPHLPYNRLVNSWAKSLDQWSLPETANADPKAAVSMTMNPFTMVRHPFDRLVSYFYYLRKFTDTSEFLKHTATDAQYERVKANDLHGWMELLHTEGGGRGLELPYQYKYVHDDIDKAIELIQEENAGTPQLYTLLTECYEVSLRLLTENFCCFEPGVVDSFMASDGYRSNSNEASYDDKPDDESLLELQSKAEVWFADDYKFYEAAVEEFLRKMAESRLLSESEKETCKFWAAEE